MRQGLAFAFYRPRFPYLPGRFALLPLAFDSALATSMRLFFKKTTSMGLTCEWPPNAEKGVPPHSRELKHNGG